MNISLRASLIIAGVVGAASLVFGDAGSLTGLVAAAAIYAIAVLGADLFVSVAGQPSLGHGAFMAVGAYASAITTVRYDWSPLLGVLTGVVISMAAAALLGSALLRVEPYYLAMATLALALGIEAFLTAASEFTGGSGGLPGVPSFSAFGLTATEDVHYILVAIVPLLAGTVYLYHVLHSPAGAALRASHLDLSAATSLGVPAFRLKVWALLWSVALASISGSLLAHSINFVSPGQFGIVLSIELLIMIALSGRSLLTGAFVGALLWGVLEEITAPYPDLRTLVTGLVLWVVIMLASSGRRTSSSVVTMLRSLRAVGDRRGSGIEWKSEARSR